MVHVEHSIVITVPRQDVWDFISNPACYPEWVNIDSVQVLDEASELKAGTQYREIGRIGPKQVITEFEVVE